MEYAKINVNRQRCFPFCHKYFDIWEFQERVTSNTYYIENVGWRDVCVKCGKMRFWIYGDCGEVTGKEKEVIMSKLIDKGTYFILDEPVHHLIDVTYKGEITPAYFERLRQEEINK
jgi:hypothetical protein